MANTLKPKRSYTASATPTLDAGELGINAVDKKVWIGNAAGSANILIASLSLADMTGSSSNITEGSNLYYLDSRARSAFSSTATGLTYTSGTGVFSLSTGYSIPTTTSQTNWDSAYSERRQWDGGSTNLSASTGRTSLGATTAGANFFTLTNPSAVTFPRINADNTVSTLDASTFRTAIGAGTSSTTGTVTSVGISVPTGLSVSGTPVTTSGSFAVTFTAGYSIPTTTSQGNWDTAYTNRISSLTTTGSSGSATLTSNTLNIPTYTLAGLGGQASSTNLTSLAGLTYVSASFVKMTSSGTFSLDTNTYLTGNQAITLSGDVSGSGSTAITVTLGTVATTKGGTNITSYTLGDMLYCSASNVLAKLSGNITSGKQFLTQTGTGTVSAAPAWASLSSLDVTTALGFTPYNSTNPNGYTSNTGTVTSVGLSLPSFITVSNSPVTTSGTLTGTLATQTANTVFAGPTTGAAAAPTFRSLVASDIPTLNQNTSGTAAGLSATLAIESGGTGQTTATAAFNALAPSQTSNNGKYLKTDGTNTSWQTVVAGSVFTVSTTAPSSPSQGDSWYDSNNAILFVYVNDGNTSQWVETGSSGAFTASNLSGGSGGTIPYQSAANTTAFLANGTSGQLLQSNGGTAAPSWVAPPAIPTGSLFPYAGSSAPSGYLLCNGQSISSSSYLALHAVISNTYGGSAYTGGSGLNFNLPDLRGRFPMGAGTGTGLNSSGTGLPSGTAQTARTAGQWGGEETHQLTTANMPSHSHNGATNNAGSHSHTLSREVLTYRGSGGDRYDPYPGTVWQGSAGAGLTISTASDHSHGIPSNGSDGRHATVPPFVVINYIIKT